MSAKPWRRRRRRAHRRSVNLVRLLREMEEGPPLEFFPPLSWTHHLWVQLTRSISIVSNMETTTTSHPILFNGAMVRAILEGRKTVTRRLATVPWCKGKRALPQLFGGSDQTEDPSCYGYAFDGPDHSGYMVLARGLNERHDHGRISLQSPYGEPGDTLWVKEAWKPKISHCCAMDACDCSDVNVFYREGGAEPVFFDDSSIPDGWLMPKAARGKGWVSPLIMPRWAARILLRVTDMSMERVQGITEEDARMEGVSSREEFAALWDSLAKPGTSWADNPWVWRVGFSVEEVKR